MRCLITDHVHPFLIHFFEQKAIETTYLPNITQGQVEDQVKNYEILIVNSKIKIDQTFADKARHLKIVGRLGSGMDGIDQEALLTNGTEVIRTPEANANAVAEHAIGMLLTLMNRIILGDQEVREGIWNREKHRGMELSRKSVGVIGVGNTGRLFANKMSALAHSVHCYDKYLVDYTAGTALIEESSMEDVLHKSDIISLHLPLNDETKHLVNLDFLKKCKPGVILINTSRGGIVDTVALIECLLTGSVYGACLDVFENEKPATYSLVEEELYTKLYKMPQVVLTPHIAGWSFESYHKIAEVMAKKIEVILTKTQG